MVSIKKTIGYVLICMVSIYITYGCINKQPTKNENEYELRIGADVSIKPIVSEILDMFNYYHPKIIADVYYDRTASIIKNFDNNVYDVIILPQQSSYTWNNLNMLNIHPSKKVIFRDALVFTTDKNNTHDKLNVYNLENSLSQFNKLIFDSRLDSSYYKYLIKQNPWIFDSNKNIAFDSLNSDEIKRNLGSNALMITNLANILSNTNLAHKLKLLSVSNNEHGSSPFEPSQLNLLKGLYLFTVNIDAIYKNTQPHLAIRFIDFIMGQIGQLIIYKYGLIPQKLYHRSIELKS